MAGLSGVRQQQALRYVRQPHRLAAILRKGNTHCPFPPKTATPSSKSLRTSFSDATRSGRIWAVKRPPRLRPHQGPTRLSETHSAPPPCSAGRGLPATYLAAAAPRLLALPKAAARIACVSTTLVSETGPRSARRAARTRKTNRPTAGPYTAAAAGPTHTCCPPHFTLCGNHPQPCLFHRQKFDFSARFKEQFEIFG
jgi:hypothetical protein